MKTILKFEKSKCAPCVMVSEFLEKHGVDYQKVNPFDRPDLAMKYHVRSVPTVIVLDDAREVRRVIGFKPDELIQVLAC